MTSSIESFVLVPFKKFNDMEEEIRKTPEATAAPPPPAEMENNPTKDDEKKTMEDGDEKSTLPSEEDAKISLATSPLTDKPTFAAEATPLATAKALKKRSFEKFLEAIDAYGTDKLGVSNKIELIKAALSQSKKVLANEDRFYAFLLKHRLIHLVIYI